MLTDFKDEDFDNKIKNEDVSVIQFSAAWCGPCKALKPIMDKLADEYISCHESVFIKFTKKLKPVLNQNSNSFQT